MQTPENYQAYVIDPVIEHELGQENLKNIDKLGKAIKKLAQEKEIETHLVLVGGNVKPEKRGKWHKDIDLVVYSPQLAPTSYFGNNNSEFNLISDFISETNQQLGWGMAVEEPWFQEYELCGDGKITLTPPNGDKPIEILPVRKDRLFGSFEDYLEKDTEPQVVIF